MIIILLLFYLVTLTFADDSPITRLSSPNIIDSLLGKNKTYEVDKSIFVKHTSFEQIDSAQISYSIEMEILSNATIYQESQLLFALRMGAAATSSSNDKIFQADFADTRGYHMRKKYFRLLVERSYILSPLNLYLSVINTSDPSFYNQNQLPEINFSVHIQETSFSENMKKCPFNCLGMGTCDTTVGQCKCNKGFFDLECSLQAYDKGGQLKVKNQNFEYSWKVLLSKEDRQQFFFIERNSDQKDYLYLLLTPNEIQGTDSQQENKQSSQSQNKLEIYYGSEVYQFTLDELKQGVTTEIFLEQLKKLSAYQQAADILVGIRMDGFIQDHLIFNYSVSLIFSSSEPSLVSNFLNNNHFTFIAFIFSLVLLVCTLVFLSLCLWRRIRLVDAAYKRSQSKKLLKQKEDQIILDLLPIFKFTQQISDQLKLKDATSDDPACSVCLCEFQEGDDMRKTYCPHYFHSDCLQLWLAKQHNCPHCRNSLSPKQIKAKQNDCSTIIERNKIQLPSGNAPLKQMESYMIQLDEHFSTSQNENNFDRRYVTPCNNVNKLKKQDSDYPMIDSGNLSKIDGALELSQQSPQVNQPNKFWLFSQSSEESNSCQVNIIKSKKKKKRISNCKTQDNQMEPTLESQEINEEKEEEEDYDDDEEDKQYKKLNDDCNQQINYPNDNPYQQYFKEEEEEDQKNKPQVKETNQKTKKSKRSKSDLQDIICNLAPDSVRSATSQATQKLKNRQSVLSSGVFLSGYDSQRVATEKPVRTKGHSRLFASESGKKSFLFSKEYKDMI